MWNKLKQSKAFYVVIAILGAIVFWLYVDIAQPSEANVPIRGIPVTFTGAESLSSEGLLIIGDSPTIDLRVSGPRSVITRLNPGNITVTASVADIKEAGVYSAELNINLPSSVTSATSQQVRIISRSASAVDVTVVKMVSKTVEIIPEFTGTVAQNRFYDEDSFALQQRELLVQGEESVVDTVSYAKVELSERNLSSTWTGWLDVVLCDKEGNPVNTENLTVETDAISVAFYVDCQKELPLQVSLLAGGGAAEENASYEITPASIIVTGQEIQLEDLESLNLGTVDLGKIITTGTYDFPITLPAGISQQNPEQTSAHVTVSINGLETRKLVTSNIQLLNAPEGHSYQAGSLEVRVRGKAEAFELLMNDDIRVQADLKEIEPVDGTKVTVPAEVVIDGISELGVLGSYSVEVSVQPMAETASPEDEGAEENTP